MIRKYKCTIDQDGSTEIKNLIDAKKFKIITGSNKMIGIFKKKCYNESYNVDQSIERQLKVLAYVRQTYDGHMDRY